MLGRNQPSDLMRAAFQDNADVIIDLSRALSLTDSLHEVEPVTVEYRNTGSIYKSLDCFRSPITFTFTLSLPSLMSFPSSVTFTATLLNASGDKRSRYERVLVCLRSGTFLTHVKTPRAIQARSDGGMEGPLARPWFVLDACDGLLVWGRRGSGCCKYSCSSCTVAITGARWFVHRSTCVSHRITTHCSHGSSNLAILILSHMAAVS